MTSAIAKRSPRFTLLLEPRLDDVEVAPRDTRPGGGLRDVAVVLREHALHVGTRERVDDALARSGERQIERERLRDDIGAPRFRCRRSRGLDRREIAEREAARDGVPQLADVARPLVLLEATHDL